MYDALQKSSSHTDLYINLFGSKLAVFINRRRINQQQMMKLVMLFPLRTQLKIVLFHR